MEDGRDHVHVVDLAGSQPRLVHDQAVARLERRRREGGEEVLEGDGEDPGERGHPWVDWMRMGLLTGFAKRSGHELDRPVRLDQRRRQTENHQRDQRTTTPPSTHRTTAPRPPRTRPTERFTEMILCVK